MSDGKLPKDAPGSAAPPASASVCTSGHRRVHLDVAHDVAQRLGAHSLRGWLISQVRLQIAGHF